MAPRVIDADGHVMEQHDDLFAHIKGSFGDLDWHGTWALFDAEVQRTRFEARINLDASLSMIASHRRPLYYRVVLPGMKRPVRPRSNLEYEIFRRRAPARGPQKMTFAEIVVERGLLEKTTSGR